MMVGDERFEIQRVVVGEPAEETDGVAITGGHDAGEVFGESMERLDPTVIEPVVTEVERECVMEKVARCIDGHRFICSYIDDLDHRGSLRLRATALPRPSCHCQRRGSLGVDGTTTNRQRPSA